MIPHSQTQCQTENVTVQQQKDIRWQQELSESQITLETLLEKLELSLEQRKHFLEEHQVLTNFPLRVTQSFIRQIKKSDPNDPLLRQIFPAVDELIEQTGFTSDPLNEADHNPAPGIVHKYKGRALLIVTQACAIHCRYCFRRHFPYQENTGNQHWSAAIDYLRKDTTLNEVILSGGDPLSINDHVFTRLTSELADIKHIQRLRIHSRLPVVLPSRINDALLNSLARWPGQTVLVIHCNHANEISPEVCIAINRLRAMNITIFNQSVLLRGVNDDAGCLAELSEKLFSCGVIPYYLHQLDAVAGATHFAVDDETAREIHSEVSARLPGYLVPKLVKEVSGDKAKRPL